MTTSTNTLLRETRNWQQAISRDAGGTNYIDVGHAGVNDAVSTSTTFMSVGGIASTTGTRVTEGDDVKLRLNRFGGFRPERQNVLIGTITTSTATTTAQIGSILTIGNYVSAAIVIDMTAVAGDTNSSTIFAQSRLDGTNWVTIAASPVITTALPYALYLTKLSQSNVSTSLNGLPGPGTARNIPFADDLRFVYSITGDTSATSFRLFVNLIG